MSTTVISPVNIDNITDIKSSMNPTDNTTINTTMGGMCMLLAEDKTGLQQFRYIYAQYHGYIAAVVCIFGIITNVANVVVLTRKNMHSSVNLILTWLAVSDLLTMVAYLPFTVYFYIMKPAELQYMCTYDHVWASFLLFYSHFSIYCHTTAIWLTICLAIFRYLYVSYPVRGPQLCTIQRAKLTILLVFLSTLIALVPNYLQNQIQSSAIRISPNNNNKPVVNVDNTGPTYSIHTATPGVQINASREIYPDVAHEVFQVHYSDLSMQYTFIPMLNFWMTATMFKLIPCILLIILTMLLMLVIHQANVRRARLMSQGRSRESEQHSEQNRTTIMLLVVVILFLITELPQGVFTMMSGLDKKFFTEIYTPMGDVLDILALLNNSINFVLYCSMSKQFRNTFRDLFCACCANRVGWNKMIPFKMNGKSHTQQFNGRSNSKTSSTHV